MTTNSEPGASAARQIHLVRIYQAPLQAVWVAWTDPAQVAQWWGPRGFTITTHDKDLRAGGHWTYTMHGPDGTDYPNSTLYHVVEPLARLQYDHGASADQPALFRVTVLFEAVDGGTRMDMTMTLPTAEAAQQTRQFIRAAGGNATWDRLAEYLGQRLDNVERFVINRSVEAPIDVVFDMWTDPAHFARWLPPTGCEMRFIAVDVRAGGESRYCMTGPGLTMYGRLRYHTIERPDRLVYSQQFCDEHGAVARHPFAPTWPETMRTVVTLTAEGEHCTRVTVTWEVEGAATEEEMATFTAGRASMTQGWTGSFDKLDAVLAQSAAG